MCEICSKFFFFHTKQHVSSMSVHSLCVSVSHFSYTSEIRRHTSLFHKIYGSNTQIWTHWSTKFAYKFSSGSFSEKFITWTDRHYGMAGLAWSNASSITLQTSDVNVSECVFMKKDDFLSIQYDCRLYVCTFQCVSLVKITSKLMLLCCIYQIFTTFDFLHFTR